MPHMIVVVYHYSQKNSGVEPQVPRYVRNADLNTRVAAALWATKLTGTAARAIPAERLHELKSPLEPFEDTTTATQQLQVNAAKHLRRAAPRTESDVEKPAIADDDSQVGRAGSLEAFRQGERRQLRLDALLEDPEDVDQRCNR